jgi:hypothetical protein
VLWFEHDLFDQLQLLQVLSQLSADAQVELVQADVRLGPLDADALKQLSAAARTVDGKVIPVARAAWQAVSDGRLDTARALDTSALPYLGAALRRLAEEREPIPRTKRQLLTALRGGPKTPPELFAANQSMEDAAFLGDTWCFLFLYELAQDGLVAPVGSGEVPLPPPKGDYGHFAATFLELTPSGRELV